MSVSIIFEDHNWQKIDFQRAQWTSNFFSILFVDWYIIIMTFTIQRLVQREICSWFVECERTILIGDVLATLSIQRAVERESCPEENFSSIIKFSLTKRVLFSTLDERIPHIIQLKYKYEFRIKSPRCLGHEATSLYRFEERERNIIHTENS